MKLGNFLSIDPFYEGVGLSRGSKLEQEVWNEFADHTYYLAQVAKSIREALNLLKEPDHIYDAGEEEFIEGKILARLHQQRERNPTLVKRKKESVKKIAGKLVCEVCDFDFEAVYGELGSGYAECHHLIPLAQLEKVRKTKLADLAIVCANCHRMLHRPQSMLAIAELRKIVQENRRINDSIE